jgi:hypothetical protein
MTLSGKKHIEKSTAEIFLSVYNSQMGSNFTISKLSDTPDVTCEDIETGDELFLEVTILEDIPGEAQFILGRGRKPISPTTRMHAVSLENDAVNQLKQRLEEKLLAFYGENTALVFRSATLGWEKEDWEFVTKDFDKKIIRGRQGNYGAGIWIICIDDSTWPVSDSLFCLSPPVRK